MDNGLLEIDFVCLTSDSLTTNVSLKPLHVVILQFIIIWLCISSDLKMGFLFLVGANFFGKAFACCLCGYISQFLPFLHVCPLLLVVCVPSRFFQFFFPSLLCCVVSFLMSSYFYYSIDCDKTSNMTKSR